MDAHNILDKSLNVEVRFMPFDNARTATRVVANHTITFTTAETFRRNVVAAYTNDLNIVDSDSDTEAEDDPETDYLLELRCFFIAHTSRISYSPLEGVSDLWLDRRIEFSQRVIIKVLTRGPGFTRAMHENENALNVPVDRTGAPVPSALDALADRIVQIHPTLSAARGSFLAWAMHILDNHSDEIEVAIQALPLRTADSLHFVTFEKFKTTEFQKHRYSLCKFMNFDHQKEF